MVPMAQPRPPKEVAAVAAAVTTTIATTGITVILPLLPRHLPLRRQQQQQQIALGIQRRTSTMKQHQLSLPQVPQQFFLQFSKQLWPRLIWRRRPQLRPKLTKLPPMLPWQPLPNKSCNSITSSFSKIPVAHLPRLRPLLLLRMAIILLVVINLPADPLLCS